MFKPSKKQVFQVGCLIGVLVGLAAGDFIGDYRTKSSWQALMIENACGQYNPATGVFEVKPSPMMNIEDFISKKVLPMKKKRK